MDEPAAFCPYKGLQPFTARDRPYFFGRRGEAERIAESCIMNPEGLLVLYGPSGVGKSSVLGAALPQAIEKFVRRPLILSFARWDRGFYSKLLDATATLSPDGSTLAATFSQPYAHLWMVDPCPSGEPDGKRRVGDTYAEVYAKVAEARARLRRLPQELQKLSSTEREEYGLQ